MASEEKNTKFITRYAFEKDKSRPGRSLQSVKVGGVFISRLEVEPGKVVGNIYYEKTNLIFFVERGQLDFKSLQLNTGERDERFFRSGDGIIHVPPNVALAFYNRFSNLAVVIMLSDQPVRSVDQKEYILFI
ncbi:MAG: hypothetical protein ABII02_00830 [Candidatus Magasanikbacteria bacterium]